MLYDAFGHKIDLGKLREELAVPTTTGVRTHLSGHPGQNLDPIRLARLLLSAEQGDSQGYLELAEEIEEKDLHYRAVLATRKLQVAGLDMVVESPTDAANDVKLADFVRDFLNTGILQESLFDILDALGKGFSVCEILWDTGSKVWWPSQIIWRDPRWFEYAREDGQTLKLRSEQGLLLDLAPAKFLVHTHKSKSGLAIRGGLARTAAWAYLFKNFDLKAWVVFCEVYGHPLRVGKYDISASKEDREVLLRAVRNLAADHAAIMPESMSIEFVDAKATGNAVVFESLADYLDRQISKLVLGQTGTTDTGSRVGTADAHEKVRGDIEISDAVQLASTINRQLIKPLIDLNFGMQKAYPRIIVHREKSEDITALVDNVIKLLPAGLRVEESVLRDKLGLPEPAVGARCLQLDAPLNVPMGFNRGMARKELKGLGGALKTASSSDSSDGLDNVDLLVQEALEDWQPLVDPMLEDILILIKDCASAEEFLEKLPEIVPGCDSLSKSLALAQFIARVEKAGKIKGGNHA